MNAISNESKKHELDFWKRFVLSERFLSGWVGKEKTPELRQEVFDFINSVQYEMVADIGSGVVSILNGTIPDSKLYVFDPLGDDYAAIFDYEKHNCVKPIAIGVEDFIHKDLYDIVHISNALDHAQRPSVGLNNLFDAVRPGGYLIIQGFENEGLYEKYAGFHQFNLSINSVSNLVCIDKDYKTEFIITNHMLAKRIKLDTGRNWFIYIVRKDNDVIV